MLLILDGRFYLIGFLIIKFNFFKKKIRILVYYKVIKIVFKKINILYLCLKNNYF